MRVIKRLPLIEFGQKHPAAAKPVDDWFRIVEKAVWKNFSEVRRTLGQADTAKVKSGNTVCIFDIGGNKFRLIAKISYEKRKVCVLRVLTHTEYDKERWRIEL